MRPEESLLAQSSTMFVIWNPWGKVGNLRILAVL